MKPLPKKTDDGFRPRIEAPLPEGFPGPGPLGEVVVKRYPDYRAAQANGGGSAFWTLFQHIKKNDIAMTAPVEMEMEETEGGGGLAVAGMAFLYQSATQGKAGTDGNVDVVDLPKATVLSVGMRGPITVEKVRGAREAIGAAVESGNWVRDGDWRLMGYNSPMVPETDRFYEIQLPVRPAGS